MQQSLLVLSPLTNPPTSLSHQTLMKDLSFYVLKNFFSSKMKKGMTNTFCNGEGSTSTLKRHYTEPEIAPEIARSSTGRPTLEEMILQLELEEEQARRERLTHDHQRGRLSCVNSSDILRSARSALNQYPRFSLDGKDAMYRSSFRTSNAVAERILGRKSACCDHGLREKHYLHEFESKINKVSCLPQTVAGKRVIWCKPGVVAKLMGLEAMPIPVSNKVSREKLSTMMKGKNLRQRAEQHEAKRHAAMKMRKRDAFLGGKVGSCSRPDNFVLKPIVVEQASNFLQVPK